MQLCVADRDPHVLGLLDPDPLARAEVWISIRILLPLISWTSVNRSSLKDLSRRFLVKAVHRHELVQKIIRMGAVMKFEFSF